MATKRPPIRLGLIITSKTEDNYFHVTAHPVTIGPNHWEMQCRDNGSYAYPDISHATIRNPGDDLINGMRLDNFQADCQGNNDDQPRKVYAWEIRYRDCYSVRPHDAEGMHKTLKTITAKMDKIADTYGRPATFGQYIAHLANAISADELLFIDGPSHGWSHRDTSYTHRTIRDGIWYIDQTIEKWIAANTPAQEQSA